MQPTLVFLSRESHGQRNLVGHSPWGRKEPDTTGWLTLTVDLMSWFREERKREVVEKRGVVEKGEESMEREGVGKYQSEPVKIPSVSKDVITGGDRQRKYSSEKEHLWFDEGKIHLFIQPLFVYAVPFILDINQQCKIVWL